VLSDLGGLPPGLCTGVAQALGITGFGAVFGATDVLAIATFQWVGVVGQSLINVMTCGRCSVAWAECAQVYPQVAHIGCGVFVRGRGEGAAPTGQGGR